MNKLQDIFDTALVSGFYSPYQHSGMCAAVQRCLEAGHISESDCAKTKAALQKYIRVIAPTAEPESVYISNLWYVTAVRAQDYRYHHKLLLPALFLHWAHRPYSSDGFRRAYLQNAKLMQKYTGNSQREWSQFILTLIGQRDGTPWPDPYPMEK